MSKPLSNQKYIDDVLSKWQGLKVGFAHVVGIPGDNHYQETPTPFISFIAKFLPGWGFRGRISWHTNLARRVEQGSEGRILGQQRVSEIPVEK